MQNRIEKHIMVRYVQYNVMLGSARGTDKSIGMYVKQGTTGGKVRDYLIQWRTICARNVKDGDRECTQNRL